MKPRAVHGTVERLVSENSIGSDGSDDADIFAPVARLVVEDALPTQRPAIRWRHGDIAARLVDEDQPIRVDGFDFFDERDPLVFDALAKLFGRAETGTTWPSSRCRRSNRETVASPTPNRCANSKYVPSSRSYAARCGASDPRIANSLQASDPPDLFKRGSVHRSLWCCRSADF